MPGYGPINMKSTATPTSSLAANTIYRLCRLNDEFVAPNYATDGALACSGNIAHGMIFQNRTTGDLYLWYGEVPAALQDPVVFKQAAYKVSAGGSFVPPMSQIGLVYMVFSTPAAGYLHHMAH